MDITEFAFRLILLFFPGLTGAYVLDTLTVHRRKEPFFFCLEAVVMGVAAYLLSGLVVSWLFPFCPATWRLPKELSFIESLRSKDKPLSFSEIGWTSVGAVAMAIVGSWVSTNKVAFKIGRWLGVTNKSG